MGSEIVQTTHIDCCTGEVTLRDATGGELAALAANDQCRLGLDHDEALREDAIRTAAAEIERQQPGLLALIEAVGFRLPTGTG